MWPAGAHRAIGIKMTAEALGAREVTWEQLAHKRGVGPSTDMSFSSIAEGTGACISRVASAVSSWMASAAAVSASCTQIMTGASHSASRHVGVEVELDEAAGVCSTVRPGAHAIVEVQAVAVCSTARPR